MKKLIKFLAIVSMVASVTAGEHGENRHVNPYSREGGRETYHRPDYGHRPTYDRPNYGHHPDYGHHRHGHGCGHVGWEQVGIFGAGVITGVIIDEVVRPRERETVIIEKQVPVYRERETIIIRETPPQTRQEYMERRSTTTTTIERNW